MRIDKHHAFADLQSLYRAEQERKHPKFPAAYIPRQAYTDKTANGLTKCIIDYITFKGGQAERINCTGRFIDTRQTYTNVIGQVRTSGSVKYVPTTGTRGTADISATIAGRSVKIEVKIGKDRQSQFQKNYQHAIERSGGIYFIAKDFIGFYVWYNERFAQ